MAYRLVDTADPNSIRFRYFMELVGFAIPAALFSLLFWAMLARVTGNYLSALILSLSLLFATLFMPYATFINGHMHATILSFVLFYLIFFSNDPPPHIIVLCGFIFPWMVNSEYPTVIHAVILFSFMVARIRSRKLLLLVPGLLLCSILFLYYNQNAFGGMFQVGYMHEMYDRFAQGHESGFSGISVPTLSGLHELLFKQGHGIFFLSPFLLFSAHGAFAGMKAPRWRQATAAACLLSVVYILLMASYYQPAERHLIPILPFLVFLCAMSYNNLGHIPRGIFLGCALFSFAAFSITTASPTPNIQTGITFPLVQYSIPLLRSGAARTSFTDIITNGGFNSFLVYVAGICFFILMALKQLHFSKVKWCASIPVAATGTLAVLIAAHAIIGQQCFKRNDTTGYLHLGKLYMKLDMLGHAETELEKVIVYNPDFERAHEVFFDLGNIAWKQNDTMRAEAMYRKVLNMKPYMQFAHYNLAILLEESGKTEEARYHYELYKKYTDRSFKNMTGEDPVNKTR